MPPVEVISLFLQSCPSLSMTCPLSKQFLASTVLSTLGHRKIKQWNPCSWEGKSDGMDICFLFLFCSAQHLPYFFLIIAAGFSFGNAPSPILKSMWFWGIHLNLWLQENTSNPSLPLRPRRGTFVATMGKEIQPFHWDCKTGRRLASSTESFSLRMKTSRVKKWKKWNWVLITLFELLDPAMPEGKDSFPGIFSYLSQSILNSFLIICLLVLLWFGLDFYCLLSKDSRPM